MHSLTKAGWISKLLFSMYKAIRDGVGVCELAHILAYASPSSQPFSLFCMPTLSLGFSCRAAPAAAAAAQGGGGRLGVGAAGWVTGQHPCPDRHNLSWADATNNPCFWRHAQMSPVWNRCCSHRVS